MSPRARQCTGALMTTIHRNKNACGARILVGPRASSHWAHALRRPCVYLPLLELSVPVYDISNITKITGHTSGILNTKM